MTRTTGSTALILAGAAAKGVFEAGALSVIAELGVPISSVMGTSAGALTGSIYAAGIRTGREKDAAQQLLALWRDHATWYEGFRPSPKDLIWMRGMATAGHVGTLLKQAVAGLLAGQDRRPVSLSLVVCPLTGTTEPDNPATSFEKVVRFQDTDFEDSTLQGQLCQTALASAAFPFVYAPVKLDFDNIGPCIDGGTVNNTPIKHAMETAAGNISRIIVIVPEPEQSRRPDPHGLDYLSHVMNILIQERLYRDLRDAQGVNQRLTALAALVGKDGFTAAHLALVTDALGWRPLEIVQIRPPTPLPGNAFSSLFDKGMRREYLEAGASAARAVSNVLAKAAPKP